MVYLRALIYRKLGKYIESEEDYQKLSREIKITEMKSIGNLVFSAFLWPLETNKKVKTN
jgi:hypothetical protein